MPPQGPTPDFTQVTLRWAGVTLSGEPITGRLELAYNRVAPLLDDDPTLPVSIYPTLLEVPLTTTVIQVADGNGGTADRTVGYASFTVPASDDPDIQGSGGTYTLTERLTNSRGQIRTFVASKDAEGGVIFLPRISSVTPVEGEAVSAVSVADFRSAKTSLATLAAAVASCPSSAAVVADVAAQVEAGLDDWPDLSLIVQLALI